MPHQTGKGETKQAMNRAGVARPRVLDPASVAKVSRPGSSGALSRARLFDALEKAAEYPLTWVSGPAGSGKTTLVASYLSEKKAACIWYRVDEGDSDVATFFYYMGLAAKKAVPRKKGGLPLFTPEYSLGVPTFTLRYFERLYSLLKPPFFIVLDNYHRVSPQSALHQVLRSGLESLPEGIRFIVASREEPPALFAPARAKGKVGFIGADAIRFDLAETKGMVRLKGVAEPSEAAVRRLHERTRGWAAGLVLLMETAKEEASDRMLSGTTPQAVFDYLAIEMFERADAETRQVLMQTAFLPGATARMAFKLTGMTRSAEILARLSRDYFFTEKNTQPEPVYRYHPLFRDFLLQQTKLFFSAEEIRGVKSRSASILEESGALEDAVRLFIEAGSWGEATRLIMARVPVLLAQGRARTVLDWMETLEPAMFERVPYLLFWQGKCRLLSDPARAVNDFVRGYDAFKSRRDLVGMSLSWAGAAAAGIYGRDYGFVGSWIPVAKEFARENFTFPEAGLEARVTLSLLGAMMFLEPDREIVARLEKRAYGFFCRQEHGDLDLRLQTGVCLTSLHLWSGNIAKAMGIVELLRGLAQRRDASDLTIITVKTVEALSGFFTASFDSSRANALEALDLAEKSGIYTWYSYAAGHAVASALAAGDMAGADVFLDKMKSNLDKAQAVDRAHYYFCLSWRARLRGDLAAALADIELCHDLLGDIAYLTTKATAHIASAEIHHRRGEGAAAKEHLAGAYAIGGKLESRVIEYMCLILDAQMRLDGGHENEALPLLAKAFALGREHVFCNTYWWQQENMTGLCMAALRAGIETDHVRTLIRQRGLFPAVPPADLEIWPWPVKIYTLGRFELQLNGEVVPFQGKPQKKTLTLLKALIALGGRQVKEEQLMDLLWPEADGDQARSALTSAVLRLRRLVGHDRALEVREGKITLNTRYCWVDAWAFEAMATRAEAVSGKPRGAAEGGNGTAAEAVVPDGAEAAEATGPASAAIGMYRGPFLPDEDQPWTSPPRERMGRRLRRLALGLGRRLEDESQWEKAAGIYEDILEKGETADEEIYRRLMTCFHRLNRASDAADTYRRCERALKEGLGTRPSAETNALYEALVK